jgi:hypothetical protein
MIFPNGQLDRSLFHLRFSDPATEAEWLEQYDRSNNGVNRLGILVCILGWMATLLYCFVFFPEKLVQTAIPVVFVYLVFLLNIVTLFMAQMAKYYQASASAAQMASGLLAPLLTVFLYQDAWFATFWTVVLQLWAVMGHHIRHRTAVIITFAYTAFAQAVVLAGNLGFRGTFIPSVVIWLFELAVLFTGYQFELATRLAYVEKRAKEALLVSILPEAVARELNDSGSSRPARIDSSTILFSDFVHFTEATKGIEPISVISLLNGYFTSFDSMATLHHVERLKTIGDGYMCAGGIPDSNATIQSMSSLNIASRHESSGIEGGINVSKGTYLLTRHFFDFESRGRVEIKGGERLEMFELKALKAKYRDGGAPNGEFLDTYASIREGGLLLGFDI